MIRILMIMLLSLFGLAASAQGGTSIFDWKGRDIVPKEAFRPLSKNSYLVSSSDPLLYTHKVNKLQGSFSDYVVKLYGYDDPNPNSETYDGFAICYKGKSILTYYTDAPLYNCYYITLGRDKSRSLQIPLDNNSFALCFGGWLYGEDYAPEMVIVVVADGKAKVVFDNYAFAYKYTPAPNFSMEFVDYIGIVLDVNQLIDKPSLRKNLRKHKIWREGNVLKYKSWK